MPTAAAISIVSAALREQISEKDLEDYTNQYAGGAIVTEIESVTTDMAKSGIRLANIYCGFGGGFNENNEVHVEAAVYGGLVKFFERCKKNQVAKDFLRSLKEIGDLIRGGRRAVVAGSTRIASDAEDRELGEDFTKTFMRLQGDYTEEDD